MEFAGKHRIPAPPEAVWAGLNDTDVLRACIPGCETFVKTDDQNFEATAKIKIGPASATFKGKVALSDMDPPRRFTLRGEGQGGVAGFAKGDADVSLEPVDGGTQLTYIARANVGGKLAQIGQRLIDGAAKQIADDFFKRFSAAVLPPLAADATVAEGAVAEALVEAEELPRDEHREGLTPQIWVIGLIAVVVILLTLFGVTL